MKSLMCFGGGTMVTVGRCRKDLAMVSEFLWRFHCRSVLLSNVEHVVSPWEANRPHPRREHFYIYRVSESSVLDPEPKVHFVRSHFRQTWTMQRRRMQPWQPGSPLIGLGSQNAQTPHYGNGVFRYLYFDCFCNDFRNLLWVFVHKSFCIFCYLHSKNRIVTFVSITVSFNECDHFETILYYSHYYHSQEKKRPKLNLNSFY